jgi:hypothetical protein
MATERFVPQPGDVELAANGGAKQIFIIQVEQVDTRSSGDLPVPRSSGWKPPAVLAAYSDEENHRSEGSAIISPALEWIGEFEPESAGNIISFQMVTIAPLARLAHWARRRNLIALTSEWKIAEARNPHCSAGRLYYAFWALAPIGCCGSRRDVLPRGSASKKAGSLTVVSIGE